MSSFPSYRSELECSGSATVRDRPDKFIQYTCDFVGQQLGFMSLTGGIYSLCTIKTSEFHD